MAEPISLIVHGLGKVGRLVRAQAAQDPALAVVATVDRDDPDADHASLEEADLGRAQALVDFTRSEAVAPLVETVARAAPHLRLVTGTSGWEAEAPRLRELVRARELYFLHGANFSVGTALFLRLVNAAADLFTRAGGFDVAVLDVHHRHKRDMPSGTARKIADALLANFPAKTNVRYGMSEEPLAPEELHVNSLRLGENKGFHEVAFDAAGEVVRLSQQTRDRSAFASGALTALKWLMRRERPGFYTFDDTWEDTPHV